MVKLRKRKTKKTKNAQKADKLTALTKFNNHTSLLAIYGIPFHFNESSAGRHFNCLA